LSKNKKRDKRQKNCPNSTNGSYPCSTSAIPTQPMRQIYSRWTTITIVYIPGRSPFSCVLLCFFWFQFLFWISLAYSAQPQFLRSEMLFMEKCIIPLDLCSLDLLHIVILKELCFFFCFLILFPVFWFLFPQIFFLYSTSGMFTPDWIRFIVLIRVFNIFMDPFSVFEPLLHRSPKHHHSSHPLPHTPSYN